MWLRLGEVRTIQLDNAALRGITSFRIGTPGDCIAWYRNQLMAQMD